MSPEKSDEGSKPRQNGAPPSLLLLLTVTGSILISYGLTLGNTGRIIAGTVMCAASLLLTVFIIRRYQEDRTARIVRACVYILIASLCALYPALTAHINSSIPDTLVGKEYSAKVISIEEGRYSDRVILSLYPLRNKFHSPVKAIAFAKHGSRAVGDNLVIHGVPETITADDPFESKRYEGIHYKIRITKKDCAVVSNGERSFRTYIREEIIRRNESLYGAKTGSVINALYLGDGYFIDRKTNYDFTRSGLLHILAASGSHVAIVAGIPLFILFLLPVPRKISFIIVSLFLALYFYATCAPVSLFRACIMFWIIALFRITGNRCSPFNALYLSGSVILMIHPWEIFSLGFRLSFGATAGIIALYNFYKASIPSIFPKIRDSLALTFSAQIGVLPIIAITLNQINFTGICANLVIVPLIEILMTGSIITLVLSVTGVPAAWAGELINSGMTFTLDLCESFAKLPGHFIFESIPAYFIVPYIALLIPLLFRMRTKTLALTMAAVISAYIPCYMFFCNSIYSTPNTKQPTCAISSREDMLREERTIRSSGYCIPVLELSDSSYESVRWNERFLQRNPVSEIRVPRSIRITPAFRSLCESIEREGSSLIFTDPHKK